MPKDSWVSSSGVRPRFVQHRFCLDYSIFEVYLFGLSSPYFWLLGHEGAVD